MVRSMALILAVLVVVFVLVPQPEGVRQPAVDDAVAVGTAGAAADELGTEPVLVLGGAERELPTTAGDAPVPVFLGDGWQLDYARTEVTDEAPTWRLGLLSPEDRRVDVEQAVDPSGRWLTRADDTSRPAAVETLDVGGTTWQRYERGDGRTAYLLEPATPGSPTTVVSAAGDIPSLAVVVEALGPALTAG
jgi:hypothetical protein